MATESQRQGKLMACLLTLQFDRTDIFFPHSQKGHSETPTLQHATLHPLPPLPVWDEGMRSTSTSPRQSSISVPVSLHGTQPHYFPLLHVAEAHQAGEQVPKTDPTAPPSPMQDRVPMGRGNPILSFEGASFTPSLTSPCTFAVTQQPDFTEMLRSEVLFSQNDPQASHFSIHRYWSLLGSALVSDLALNKLAEILELVRTAWCCP